MRPLNRSARTIEIRLRKADFASSLNSYIWDEHASKLRPLEYRLAREGVAGRPRSLAGP